MVTIQLNSPLRRQANHNNNTKITNILQEEIKLKKYICILK